MWDFISAIPAIATIYGWFKERRDKKHGNPILVGIKELAEPQFSYFPEDFTPLEITFRNDNPFGVILKEIAITNVQDGIMGVGVREPSLVTHIRRIVWNPTQILNKDVYMLIPLSLGERGVPITTGTSEFDEIFFVSHDAIRACNNILDFCLTFCSADHENKTQKVHVRGVFFRHWRKQKTGITVEVNS